MQDKKVRAAELMWNEDMKPRDVAVKLGLSRQTVYEAARKFRKSCDRAAGEDLDYVKCQEQEQRRERQRARARQQVVTKIQQFVRSNGISRISIRRIQLYLSNCLIDTPHVSTATIRKYLQEEVGLAYRPVVTANPMYNAPLFDEARYWTA